MRKLTLAALAVGMGLATATHAAASPAGPAPESARLDTGIPLPGGPMPDAVKAFLDAHPVPAGAAAYARAKAEAARVARSQPTHGRLADGAGGAVAPRFDGPSDTYLWTIDDFDSSAIPDPSLWTMMDLDLMTFGDYQWGLSQCRASNGTQSLWAVGSGDDGSRLTCEDVYPSGANSSAMLAIDLSRFSTPPSQLDFLVDFWLNTRIFEEAGVAADGLFVSYLKPRENQEPERIVLVALTSQYPERFFADPLRIDMLQAREVYPPYREVDLSQDPAPLMEFLFMSRDPNPQDGAMPTTFMGGAFIDNVRIETDVSPGPARRFDPAQVIAPLTSPWD